MKDERFVFLNKLERFVFQNINSFLKVFAPRQNIMELLDVWFNSTSIKFYYVLESGQHITDEIALDTFMKWRKDTIRRQNEKILYSRNVF